MGTGRGCKKKQVNTYKVPSSSQPDKTYTITQYGSKKGCECPAYQFRHTCRHIKAITPTELQRQKRIASKAGREVIPLLRDVQAYDSVESKINSNPALKQFMDETR